MCGIIGFIGKSDAVETTINGLYTLEYRGYDSAGLCFQDNGRLEVIKTTGAVAKLEEKVNKSSTASNDDQTAIGHTRWATHGGVTETNAHPHASHDGRVCVVHNGIIENYAELIELLESRGIYMQSQTDTEVIPNLISFYLDQGTSPLDAVRLSCEHLQGSYAFLAILNDEANLIIAAKHGNQPMIIGQDKDKIFISSDVNTTFTQTKTAYVLEDDQFCVAQGVDKGMTLSFYSKTGQIIKENIKRGKLIQSAEKNGFATFMEKEIHEIPEVVRRIVKKSSPKSSLGYLFSECETVHLFACGTAYYASLVIGTLIEKYCKIRSRVYLASELDGLLIKPGDIGIVVSQSGETADTIGALAYLKKQGIKTIAICNTPHSTITRRSDYCINTLAGPEMAVASTKAYSAQVLSGALLVNNICKTKGLRKPFRKRDFDELPNKIIELINSKNEIRYIAKEYRDIRSIFFLGKGLDALASLECALKVKELTYKHCEGFASGELKHGTLSLVDRDTLTITLLTDIRHKAKVENAMHEVTARGSHLRLISSYPEASPENFKTLPLPQSPLSFVYSIIPAQFFALYLAQELGHDPDRPRNLAKSITVE